TWILFATLGQAVGAPAPWGVKSCLLSPLLLPPSWEMGDLGVSGQPCLVLEWEKDGHKLSDLFETSHFAVGQEPEDWHFLKLFGARPPDGGVYVCRARSGSREALAAAVLLVESRALLDGLPNGSPADGPEPLSERQQRRRHAAGWRAGPETWVPNGMVPTRVPGAKAFAVSVGKHAKFRCYVTGKPKPEIVWQKDVQAEGCVRRLLLRSAGPLDTGMYTCDAGDDAVTAVSQRVELWCQLSRPAAPVPAGLPVLLECHVSPPGAPIRWLKDGEAVPLDDVIAVQAEGCVRRLLLRSAGPLDTGMYTCDAGDDAVSFVVTVTGELGTNAGAWTPPPDSAPAPLLASMMGLKAAVSQVPVLSPTLSLAEAPVKIVSSNEEAPHTYVAGQRVELWCQLSRPAAPVCWYKDGEEVEADKSLVLEQEGPWHQLVLPCARPQDTGEFICNAGDVSISYHVSVAGWWHSRVVL
uniref:Obscurin like cytoskeletal adaptor 1 n=1 Tax=Bubo bubo TaxID=30461 RepID=A0A8C0ELY0_BUBBB